MISTYLFLVLFFLFYPIAAFLSFLTPRYDQVGMDEKKKEENVKEKRTQEHKRKNGRNGERRETKNKRQKKIGVGRARLGYKKEEKTITKKFAFSPLSFFIKNVFSSKNLPRKIEHDQSQRHNLKINSTIYTLRYISFFFPFFVR